MPWSLPISEPVGTIAGIAVGELASHGAKKVSNWFGCSEQTAQFITTSVGHYTGALTTKAIINISLGDPVGLGVNPLSSGITAVGHGCYQAHLKPAVKLAFKPVR